MREVKKFYKNILKYLFFLINKKLIIKKKEEKYYTTSNIKFEKKKYKIFTLDKGKIYMDTSEGKYFYIFENIILQKLSIDTDNLSKISNIIKYGIIKFCKRYNFKVVSIISGRDAKDNYYHWVIDVLPRLIILQNEIKNKKFLNLLVPNYNKNYQKESLNCLIKNKKINFINFSKYKFMQFKQIILSSNNEKYEYFNFSLLSNLKNKILAEAKKKFKQSKYKYKKIFISRSDANLKYKRNLKNNLEIENYLIKKGFKVLILSNYSFLEQALIFNNANLIVGLHGAGLTNILFCKKKTKIIEISLTTWPDMYKKLSNCLKLSYKKILAEEYSNVKDQVTLSILKIKNFL